MLTILCGDKITILNKHNEKTDNVNPFSRLTGMQLQILVPSIKKYLKSNSGTRAFFSMAVWRHMDKLDITYPVF